MIRIHDYDLLGLEWQGVYVDMYVPFGTRHGSQIFQRLRDAVRYMMRQKGFVMVDYIDDYVGMGVPRVACASYNALTELMGELGLTISEKKLVPRSTQVTCLGVLLDTVKGMLSIPPKKCMILHKQCVIGWTRMSCQSVSCSPSWVSCSTSINASNLLAFFLTECKTCSDLLMGVKRSS